MEDELSELEEIQLDLAKMREKLTQRITFEIEDFEIRLSRLRHRLELAMEKQKAA